MAAELSFLGPLISLVKEFGGYLIRRFRKPDPVAVLKHRDQLRAEFQARLRAKDRAGTHGNAIIRDIKRMDRYPEISEKDKGISPWFKVEVKGLYHRGLESIINVETLVFDERHQNWRWGRYDEHGAVNVLLVGRIPFDAIRTVSWDGDEYYPVPHVYCDFSKRNGEPYEELVYFETHDNSRGTYYLELANLKDVRQLSMKLGYRR